jgi:hypothetical protein
MSIVDPVILLAMLLPMLLRLLPLVDAALDAADAVVVDGVVVEFVVVGELELVTIETIEKLLRSISLQFLGQF